MKRNGYEDRIYETIANSYDCNDYGTTFRKDSHLSIVEKSLLIELADTVRQRGECKILDVGCGDGKLFDVFLKEQRCTVYGVDISPKQVERASEVIDSDKLAVANFIDPTYNSDIMDGIICMYTLFHFLGDDQRKALQKMYSTVRCGGVVLLNARIEYVDGYKYSAHWCNAPMFWSLPGAYQVLFWCTEIGFLCKVYENPDNPDYVIIWLEKPVK